MTDRFYSYHGLPASPIQTLPCWHSVDELRDLPQSDTVALHFALFDDADGQVRAEVRRRRNGVYVAQLWRRDEPDTLLWSRDYRPAEPGWSPYRDVMGEAVKVTRRPLPEPLREHVQKR